MIDGRPLGLDFHLMDDKEKRKFNAEEVLAHFA
jgi:hypothetical protein